MRRFPLTSLFLCVAGAAALLPVESKGDEWRVPRHDQGRSGVASGPVALSAPNVSWRTFLGGSPGSATVLFAGSTTTLSSQHAVILRGGRFIALNIATQQALWQSDLLGSGQVVAIADLNGDDVPEVVVQTQTQAHVLSSVTGETLWSSSVELVPMIGATRVRDIDGDGLADVYIDNAVGAKAGIDAASAYSFATGQAQKLWAFPVLAEPMTISSGTDALLDLDGDGESEVVLTSFTDARILRGGDGSLLTTLPAPPIAGNPLVHASAFAADLDGQGDLEVLLVQEIGHVASQVGPNIVAYQVDVASGQSQVLWSADTGSFEAELAASTDVSVDVDGDSVNEVVFSFRLPGGDWTTQLLSGADGSLIAELGSARFEGAAELDGEPGNELVLATAAGMQVMKLDSSSAFTQLGSTIPARRGVSMTDALRRSSAWIDRRLATVPRPGKLPLLLAGEVSGEYNLSRVGAWSSIDGYELVSGDWQLVGTQTPLIGKITAVIAADHATRPYDQVALGTTLGTVTVLNQFMQGTNGLSWIDGSRLGAFVAGNSVGTAPLVGSDAAGPFALLQGTAIGTVAADARFASWIIPPIPRWANSQLTSPSILDLDGETRVVGVFDRANLAAFNALNGAQVASVALPDGYAWSTPVALRAGAQTLVGIDWRNNGGEIYQRAFDLQGGTSAFVGDPILMGGFFGSSVGDLDANGVDEWYSMTFASLWRRDVSTGLASTLASFPDMNYSLPTVISDTAGNPTLLLQGGWVGPARVGADGSLAWQAALNQPTNGMAGVVLECGAQQRYVTPGVLSPTLSFYDASTGTLLGERTYAGGAAYADVDAATLAGHAPGIFGNLNGVDDLDGGPAVLGGSSDGHVYVVDPCTSDLRWAADLGASAGEPIIADVDGDGEDEILVATADGFLQGLDDFSFPAPFITLSGEVDGALGLEVGQVANLSWAAVEGATSYEIALIGPDEKPLWSPAYRAANGTSAEVELTGALAGRPYRVAVRVAGADPGQEAFSGALIINDTTAPAVDAVVKGGDASEVSIQASDDLALDFAMIAVTGESGVPLILQESLLSGAEHEGALSWKAVPELFGQDVIVEVVAVDSAGLSSSVSHEASIGEDGFITYASEDPPIDGEPEGPAASNGCACETTPQRGAWPSALLMIGLAVAAAARRRSS